MGHTRMEANRQRPRKADEVQKQSAGELSLAPEAGLSVAFGPSTN